MLYNISQAASRPVNSCRACVTTACLTGTSGHGPAAGKVNWHPDRCGFFDRVSQDSGPCAGAGAAAWRICACCHCITWRMRIPSSNACAPCIIGSTSKVLRVRVRDKTWRIEWTVMGVIVYLRSRISPSGWQGTILSFAKRSSSCRITLLIARRSSRSELASKSSPTRKLQLLEV
jgi:hypothetical protein